MLIIFLNSFVGLESTPSSMHWGKYGSRFYSCVGDYAISEALLAVLAHGTFFFQPYLCFVLSAHHNVLIPFF